MRYSRCFLTLIACTSVGLSVGVVPAEAHVLKTDGAIGAVLHIDPDDDPIIGQQANFVFEFKDRNGQFSPSACTCTVVIRRDGQTLSQQSLTSLEASSDTSSESFSYTFPQAGVYEVVAAGAPASSGAFQPFSLTYDLRVTRVAGQATKSAVDWDLLLHHGVYVVGILVLVGLIVYDRRKQRKNDADSKPTPPTPPTSTILSTLLIGMLLLTPLLQLPHHHMSSDSHDHVCCLPVVIQASQPATSSISEQLPTFVVEPIIALPLDFVPLRPPPRSPPNTI